MLHNVKNLVDFSFLQVDNMYWQVILWTPGSRPAVSSPTEQLGHLPSLGTESCEAMVPWVTAWEPCPRWDRVETRSHHHHLITWLRCAVLSHFSHVWLSAAPCTVAHQTPLSVEFSRQEYWSGLSRSPPGDLPDPGIEPSSLRSPVLAVGFFTSSATWEVQLSG